MSDRPDLINSEMGGVAFNSIDACFKQVDLKRMFNQSIQITIPTGNTFFVTVDPAAGGENSDFAVVSFTMLHGVYKVLFLSVYFASIPKRLYYDTRTILLIFTNTASIDAALCCVVIGWKKFSSEIDKRTETAVCGFNAVKTTFCPKNGFCIFAEMQFFPPMTNSIFFCIILSLNSVSLLFCCVFKIQCLIFESIERKKKNKTTI